MARRASTVPRAASVGEETLAMHAKAYGLAYEREVTFAPGRKFRFDFLFPGKLAVEVDGGTRMMGRHSRHGGITSDCVKYNLAVRLGYRVLRFTTEMVTSGEAIDWIRALTAAASGAESSVPPSTQRLPAAIDTSA